MMSSALYNCRNIIFTNCRRFNVRFFSKNSIPSVIKFKELQSNAILPSNRISTISRCLSTQPNTDSHDDKPAYIPLMEYPEVIWPGFFRMVKCWFTLKMVLPSLDQDFDLIEFMEGSQQAITVISDALSNEDYESLDGLVAPEAVEILKKNISKMSDDQKRQIKLHKGEFFFHFPWDIKMRNGPDGSSKIVEVLMVYHIVRNWKGPENPAQLVESATGMQRLEMMQQMVSSSEYLSNAIVCNYQFIRQFGTADKSWLVNIANQFKLSDLQE